ncbi:MAG TPA: hypothetical protein VHX59_26915 [Mycobacteriales bacterium]|jgi:hypothetical protein|nr:hypothetical protein [Mycobacteriales bacterium]
MLHPVGRLPESTYWRRRTIVVLALVLTVVLVKSVLLSGGNSDAATRPASSSSPSPTPSLSPAAVPSPRAKPSASKLVPPKSPAPKSPAPKVVTSKVVASRTAAAKHGPLPTCTTRSLALFVGAARDYYRVGQIADLTLSVVNVSDASCRGEVGPKVQEALIYKGDQRLWSSNDCYPGSESDIVTLPPGVVHRLVIRWSGDSSKPGCAGKRARIGAGTYTVIGHVGKLEKRGVLVLRG